MRTRRVTIKSSGRKAMWVDTIASTLQYSGTSFYAILIDENGQVVQRQTEEIMVDKDDVSGGRYEC